MTLSVQEIKPSGPVNASVRPPGSKSITNRALICAALADGASQLRYPLDSDDTRVMIDSLRRLGISVEVATEQIVVAGTGGDLPEERADLFIGNSGTSVRFLTALVAIGRGEYRLDGVERMRERPIQDLVDALNHLGARLECEHGNGCPPVVVHADGLLGGEVAIRGGISSQYLSGLLMAAPYARGTVRVSIDGELVSRPYVAMTTAVMRAFGCAVDETDGGFVVRPQVYSARSFEIEPDASAASYFWAAAAITGGRVTVNGLDSSSLQGDVQFTELLRRMGCEVNEQCGEVTVVGQSLHGIECDMSEISDTAQTLSAVALFAEGPTTIRGIAHNRHKETDRIGNLAIELRKFGAQVEELADGLRIIPPSQVRAATVQTYDDHRMAMSLALPGLRVGGVRIANPECTAKTYPHFFKDLLEITT